MKTLAREARRRGVEWIIEREGGRHTLYRLGETLIPVPRHAEIDEGLAEGIFKQCEAELGKGWWRR